MAAMAAKLPPAPGKMVEQMLRGEEPERRWICVGHGTQSGPGGGDGALERMEAVGGKHTFGGWQIWRATVLSFCQQLDPLLCLRGAPPCKCVSSHKL